MFGPGVSVADIVASSELVWVVPADVVNVTEEVAVIVFVSVSDALVI
jgi:hypothetical protein